MEKKVTGEELCRLTNDSRRKVKDTLIAFIKENQGEKGYIDTSEPKCVNGNILVFCNGNSIWESPFQVKIMGVRVKERGGLSVLQIATEPYSKGSVRIRYTEESFRDEENWDNVCCSDLYDTTEVINALGMKLKFFCTEKPRKKSEEKQEKKPEEKPAGVCGIRDIHDAVDMMNGYDKIDLIMYILNDREVYSWMEEYMKPL